MNAQPLTGIVVCLDDASVDDLVGPVEVMVQEGLRCFSLPVGTVAIAELVAIFGRRARFGAHAVGSAAEVWGAAGAGVGFALLDTPHHEVVAAAREAGLATYPPAMTPSEVRWALEQPVDGVQLYPADVVGHSMASRLKAVGLGEHVVPRGGVGAYAAGEWLKAGAKAACVDEALLGDALRGGDLASLRDRCGAFVRVQES